MPTLATSEKRLISTLLENYKQNGVEGRPVLDTSRPLSVAVGFTPVQMLSYDEHEQIISLVGWINLVRVNLCCAGAFFGPSSGTANRSVGLLRK